MKNISDVKFIPLDASHFSLMYQWFNEPHVQKFYALRPWSLDEIETRFLPHIRKEEKIDSFIIQMDNREIGYIQKYALKDHAWSHEYFSQYVLPRAAGMDLFIAEKKLLSQGLGKRIITSFLTGHIWPYYEYCVADPDMRNNASIKCFEKCGFEAYKTIETKDTLGRDVFLILMMQRNEEVNNFLDKIWNFKRLMEKIWR